MKNIIKLSLLAILSGTMLAGCGGQTSSVSSTPVSSAPVSSAASTSVKTQFALPEFHVYKNMKYTYDNAQNKTTVYRVGVNYFHEIKEKAIGADPEKNYLACYVFNSATSKYVEFKTADGVTVETFKDAQDWKPTNRTAVNEDVAIGAGSIFQHVETTEVYTKTDPSEKVTFTLDGNKKEVTTILFKQDTLVPQSYYWYQEIGLFSLPVKVIENNYQELNFQISDVDTTVAKLPGNVVFPAI